MKIIFVDLDDTIVNSSEFKQNFFNKLVAEHNAVHDDLETHYQTVKEHIGQDNWVELFVEGIAKHTKKDPKIIEELLWGTFKQTSIHKPLLDKLETENAKKVILTFGNKQFQSIKISHLPLNNLFTDIIITDRLKDDVLAELIENNNLKYLEEKYDEAILIDDKRSTLEAVKQRFPFIKTYTREEYVEDNLI